MSQPTTAVFFNASDPAPPPGLQNTVPQTDGGQPAQKITSFMPLAIPGADGAAGAVKPDGTSITQDEDGTIHAVATSSGGTGTGTSASGGQQVCVVPAPDPTDGTRTQWILPAPVLAGTDYWLNRNDTIQRQLGPKAYYSVQGTQLTLVSPLESDGYIEFHYMQGTPNSESGGGGSVNPIGAPVIRGSAMVTSGSGGDSSLTLALPAGSQAGDFAIYFFNSAWTPTALSGWTSVYLDTSGTNKIDVRSKILTSGDISAGSITCTQTDSPFGPQVDVCALSIVVFVGATGGVRETEGQQGSGSPLTLTNTTTGAVINTDAAIYYSSARAGAIAVPTITPASGAANALQSSTSGSFSGAFIAAILADQAMPGGALSVANLCSGGAGSEALQIIVMATS